MAWPNPFGRRDEHTRTYWGYTFQITDQHLTPEQSHPMKFSYDLLGEQALERLNAISPPPRSALPRNSNKCVENTKTSPDRAPGHSTLPKRDLYILLKEHADQDETLGALWEEVNTVPAWVDWTQIARGQEIFYRYGGPILTGLAYQSLLGGMGANRVVETLARTGGFAPNVARHRLFETTQHLLQCTQSIESIRPGGAGHASSIRVRLLHAAVRQRIMSLAQQRPEYYDVAKWGIPINDLDCIATIGTFSATLVWLSLPRQGIWLRQQEVVDYIALFRYIGYLTGTPTGPFETPEKARVVMESLLMNEISPSETSKVLANNIITCLEGQPPSYASRSFLEANSRWLNGNELCDRLGLGKPGLYYWALVAGQCLFFTCICYFYRAIPYLDRRKIAALRKIFWAVIVENKHGLGGETMFDFKYIPDYHMKSDTSDLKESGLKYTGIERRNLKAFLVGCGVLSVMGFCVCKIVIRLAKNVIKCLTR